MVRSRAALLAVLVAAPPAFAAPHHHHGARGAAAKRAPAPAAADAVPVPDQPPPGVHDEGAYGGVAPDRPKEPDQRPRRKPAPGTLSWIGFEAKDGGAEVFLQSVAPFELSQHVAGSMLIVDTPLRRLGQNTWRDVDTRYFDSPIAHVIARRVGAMHATRSAPAHGAGVEVRIAFKNPKDAQEASVRTATGADGMYYAYLSFSGAPAK